MSNNEIFECLDKNLKLGLVKYAKPWYTMVDSDGNVSKLGMSRDKVNKILESMESNSVTGADIEDSVQRKEQPQVALEKIEQIEQSQKVEQSPYDALMSDLADISKFREGSDFDIFIYGVDSRFYRDKRYLAKQGISDCPYYFAWIDTGKDRGKLIETSNRSGEKQFTVNGWAVVSKSKIIDPRTQKRWLEVKRDDTPNQDYVLVGTHVLCYCLEKQWLEIQEEQVMRNITRTSEMADGRIEKAKNMAKVSKQDPRASMKGFVESNTSEKRKVAEFVGMGNQAMEDEAMQILSDLDKINDTSEAMFAGDKIAKLKQDVANGLTSQSVQGSKILSIPT